MCGALVELTEGGGTRAEGWLRTLLWNPALLLFMAGMVAFHRRQADRSGAFAVLGFAICQLGTATMLLGNVAEFWGNAYLHGSLAPGWRPGWLMIGGGLLVLPVGLVIFGIATLRARVFTGWRRAVPLGFGLVLAAPAALSALAYWNRSEAIEPLFVDFFAIGAGWAALGSAAWREPAANAPGRPPAAAATGRSAHR